MKLIPYIRVSTDEQDNSPKDQLAMIKRWAQAYNIELAEPVCDIGISAGTEFDKRAGGKEVKRRLLAGEADGIACTELDRMFRLLTDGIQNLEWFASHGFSLHALGERIEAVNPDDWLSAVVKLAVGEWERRKTQFRTARTMRSLRKDCRSNSPAPYGCVEVIETIKDGEKPRTIKKLFKNPDTWPVRQSIVDMKADGMSLDAIRAELQRQRIPAPGGYGKGKKPKGGRLWHKSTLSKIIQSHHTLEHIPMLPESDDA
ncbi:MAG: recombinase family protein [Pseudomonadota bacterium]|nr:recombinase family protein [Pseudomonadota bacterium]